MKKLFSIFCAVCLAFAFTSCDKEDTSSLDFGVVTGTATLTGYVYYNIGFSPAAGTNPATTTTMVPYANQSIGLWLHFKDGKKMYTVTTDANGQYSIDLPAIDSECSVSIDIQFEGTKRFQSTEDPTKAVTQNGVYSYSWFRLGLTQDEVSIMNIDITRFNSLDEYED